MGFPLGSIIANIFMNHIENNHYEEMFKKGVKSWDRFVDDTCVIVKPKDILILNENDFLRSLSRLPIKFFFVLSPILSRVGHCRKSMTAFPSF